MSARRVALIAIAMSLSLWAAADSISASAECAMVARPWLRPDTLRHFTATARPDTLFVRLFRRPSSAPDGSDTAAMTAYGQVARLDRVSASLAAALEGETGVLPPRVALVRWGADSLCRRDLPGGSAQWLEPNEEGFFAVAPLPESQWVPGTPTFDVDFADVKNGLVYLPDALDRVLRPSWWRRLLYARPMTLDEFRLFHEALPTWSEWQADRLGAARALDEWARQNRGIAAREPARSALDAMRAELQTAVP